MNPTATKLANYIATSLSQALAALTGREYTVSSREHDGEPAILTDPVVWQQIFSVITGPALWLAAGRDLWESAGRTVLEAAGIETVTEQDCRSTWQEIIGQTVAGIASGITADVLKEVTAMQGGTIDHEPVAATWFEFSVTEFSVTEGAVTEGAVTEGSAGPLLFKAAWSAALARLSDGAPALEHTPPARDNASSKTLDLLLEVALPVSVSFGRTSLQIREILKLNTGSIVELDRLVADPVEVIVNDCVIARGEVVVIDGNYGVRISELASREERIRTGFSDPSRIGVRP